MNQQAVRHSIKDDVEQLAEQFIMADLSDAGVVEELVRAFGAIAAKIEEPFPRTSSSVRTVAAALEQVAASGGPPGEADLRAAEKVLTAIQALIDRDADESELDLPGSAPADDAAPSGGGLGSGGTAVDDSVKPAAAGFASGVDEDILDEYLAHQETVIGEIEELILEYERHPDAQILKELKRYLHTAKGEAGVVGLNAVERVCHQVEDYIQDGGESLDADPLLEFKDWFDQTIAAIKNRSPLPLSETLMAALRQEVAFNGFPAPSGPDAHPEPEPEPDMDAGDPAAEDAASKRPGDTPVSPVKAEKEPEADTHGREDADTAEEEAESLLTPVMIEDPEITADFVSETIEHFEVSDENLLTLENDPENEEAIASIFRAFHTIKGTTSFLGLTPIARLAHVAENLLDEVRKKRLSFEGAVVDATFNALDLLKKMTRQLETALGTGDMFIPDNDLPDVFLQLKDALAGGSGPAAGGGQAAAGKRSESRQPESNAWQSASPSEKPPEDKVQSANDQAPSGNGIGKTVKQTMKIDADRIDLLLETIGELVIVESIVNQEAAMRSGEGSGELERNLAQLTKITRSLQDMGMSMRLIPIDNTFPKMGRLVRDLAKKSGKKIELSMEGRETELDKGMVEKLGDPLVHMIRNAVDHGIEPTPEDRTAAGKNSVGQIVLKAFHQGGGIHIEIRDDGRGLDRDAIAAKALERGLTTGTDNMTDEEIFSLIFEPGFSTAAKITDVSGRGVGMDVVRSNIESMRGNVRIRSEKGKGSVFTLVLPLTMAIIDGMIVRIGSERYILPLLSIIESFKPTEKMISTVSGRGETVPFRSRLLPLFRLYKLFGIDDAEADPTRALVVVIEDAGRQVALLVDELLGQNQTVIKNLGAGLRAVEGIAGASIMADGKPGLIIDVNGLVKLATA